MFGIARALSAGTHCAHGTSRFLPCAGRGRGRPVDRKTSQKLSLICWFPYRWCVAHQPPRAPGRSVPTVTVPEWSGGVSQMRRAVTAGPGVHERASDADLLLAGPCLSACACWASSLLAAGLQPSLVAAEGNGTRRVTEGLQTVPEKSPRVPVFHVRPGRSGGG